MTRKRKVQRYIVAVFLTVCCIGWIALLYIQDFREKKAWEQEFLTRYHAAMNDLICDLDHFKEMKSFEEQLSCLGAITNDMMQLKAYMEIHVNLITISMPEVRNAHMDPAGWREMESIIGLINNGGFLHSEQIESFQADGFLSEEEAAVILLMKKEMDRLYSEMTTISENGGNYKYALSSIEVYQHLTEISYYVKSQILQIHSLFIVKKFHVCYNSLVSVIYPAAG